jgi:hypothetical protein
MAAGSIALSVLSFACMVAGVLTTPIPGVGAAFSFGAVALAVGGVVMGGKAMSRAKQQGAGAGVAQAGVILSALALAPALMTAMTCGVCNAFCANGRLETQRSFNVHFGQPLPEPPGDGGTGTDDAQRGAPSPHEAPPSAPPDKDAPPPVFPPPPIAPKAP